MPRLAPDMFLFTAPEGCFQPYNKCRSDSADPAARRGNSDPSGRHNESEMRERVRDHFSEAHPVVRVHDEPNGAVAVPTMQPFYWPRRNRFRERRNKTRHTGRRTLQLTHICG